MPPECWTGCAAGSTIGIQKTNAMWLFTRYGFYSIASAKKVDGSLDSRSMMVRARVAEHLSNLKKRFSVLADAEVLTLPERDYRYRLIVPKQVWVSVAAELAEEQEWSNFKDEAARYQGKLGSEYIGALHRVWTEMYQLQRKSR
jgi:hypothetical protein